MKTIKQYVEGGISTLEELRHSLQIAMRLEFATIPPYLCAQWSIRRDPDRVEGVLHRIVSQEMYHFALAGNLLTAIGGRPKIAHAGFLPRYPTKTLPGGIAQKIPIDLKPLSRSQLKVFMQIEYPEFPPVALQATKRPATIGAFYDTIIDAFKTLKPKFDASANAVPVPFANRIEALSDAIALIDRIKREGEGVRGSPEEPTEDQPGYAHYYLFKEIFVQRRLIRIGHKWRFKGDHISLPDVYRFKRAHIRPNPSVSFNRALSKLLIDLEACWASGAWANVAAMFELQMIGRDLIKNGIRPDFRWDAAAPAPPARRSSRARASRRRRRGS